MTVQNGSYPTDRGTNDDTQASAGDDPRLWILLDIWTSSMMDKSLQNFPKFDSDLLKTLKQSGIELVDDAATKLPKPAEVFGKQAAESIYKFYDPEFELVNVAEIGAKVLDSVAASIDVKEAQEIAERSINRSGLKSSEREIVLNAEKGVLSGNPKDIGKALSELSKTDPESAIRIQKQIVRDLKKYGLDATFDKDGGISVSSPSSRMFYIGTNGEVSADQFDLGGGKFGGRPDDSTPEDQERRDRSDFWDLGRMTATALVKENHKSQLHFGPLNPDHSIRPRIK